MEAAARLQRHPQSRGASRHHSSDGSNNASSKGMHLCWWISLVPSVQPWGWLHPRCLQDGILIIYLTAAPSSGKDSPFPQVPARSKIHRELESLHPSQDILISHEAFGRVEKEEKPSQSSVSRKIPCFQGSFKDQKKKASQEKKKSDPHE